MSFKCTFFTFIAIVNLIFAPLGTPLYLRCENVEGYRQGLAIVTFSASGLGTDVLLDSVVIVVDGIGYTLRDLPKSFTWPIDSFHTFQWSEVVESTAEGKRYVWNSTSGISTGAGGLLIVPADGGTITAEYKAQYLWVISAEGLGDDVYFPRSLVSVDGVYIDLESLPFGLWWDKDSQHVCCFERYVLSTSGYKRYAADDPLCVNLTVLSSGALNKIYHPEYRVYLGVGRGNGTTDPPPGEYWIGAGDYLFIRAIPSTNYAFDEWSELYAECSTYGKYDNPTAINVCGPIGIIAQFRQIKPFDFAVSVSPISVTVYKGGSALIGVVVFGEGEPVKDVNLYVSGEPPGISCTLGTESGLPPFSTSLTISASRDARAGTYVLKIVGVSNNITREQELSITVLEPQGAPELLPWALPIIIASLLPIALYILIRSRRKSP